MLTVIPGSTGPATVETAAFDAASGCLMDVHGVLHDDWHLGLQLCVPDAFLEEPCVDGKEPLSASFFWACPPAPKYSFGQVGDTLICPLQNTVPPQTTVCS